MLIKPLPIGPDREICYLVGCDKTGEAVVIDPPGRIGVILEEAKKENLVIKYVFNTHYHADHTGGNKKLHRLTGAKILIHRLDVKPLLKKLDPIKIWFWKLSVSPLPDIIVERDMKIKVGEIEFSVFHTPGHTLGGLCFYAVGNLFTGDTLFTGDSGYTNLPGGDRKTLGQSLRRIMSSFPDDTVVRPGHDFGKSPSSTIGWEKANNKNAKEYGFYSRT